jgi:hypothetical protein
MTTGSKSAATGPPSGAGVPPSPGGKAIAFVTARAAATLEQNLTPSTRLKTRRRLFDGNLECGQILCSVIFPTGEPRADFLRPVQPHHQPRRLALSGHPSVTFLPGAGVQRTLIGDAQ